MYDNFELLEELVKEGLDGVEVWHPENTQEQQDFLKTFAKKHKLLMTGGSDFHGMYSAHVTTLASCETPEENLAALLSYQAKQRRARKKAAKVEAAEAEKA